MRSANGPVVHVLGRLDVGGAERMLLSVCRSLSNRGPRHVVVALSGRSGTLTDQFASVGVAEFPCGLSPLPTFPWRLWTTLRRLRPAVVISHVSLASAFVLALSAAAGVPRRVAVFHSDGDGRALTPRRRAYRAIARALLRTAATDVVGVTESTLEFSGLASSQRVAHQVIPNAVDLAEFTPVSSTGSRIALRLPSDVTVLAHIGRAAPEKNRRILPSIMERLQPGTDLVLAGASSHADLEIGESAIDDLHIHDLGMLDDVREALSAADLLVLPSVREGLPLVVLEALACGRPVVASELPGLRFAADRLPDIHLVKEHTSAAAFAESVRCVIANPRTPEQIRQTLVDSEFDLTTAVERWAELCRTTD